MSTASYLGFHGYINQNTATNAYYAAQTTATGDTLTVGGTADSFTYSGWPWQSASSSTSYNYSYTPAQLNLRRVQDLMLLLHPQPSFSSWAVQLWEGKLSECMPTGLMNIVRVPKQRLYFVFYEGQLLVAAKSLVVAKRCASVLHLMTPEPASWTYTA